MWRIMRLFKAHGEKIGLGVVVVLALYSLASALLRNSATVIAPDGSNQQIDRTAINSDIDFINQYIRSAGASQESPKRQIVKTSEKVKGIINVDISKNWRSRGFDSPFYLVPPTSVEAPPPPEDFLWPNAEYLPRLCPPAAMTAKAGGNGVAVVFEIEPGTRWVEGMSARVWRKNVGYAKDDVKVGAKVGPKGGEKDSAPSVKEPMPPPSRAGGISALEDKFARKPDAMPMPIPDGIQPNPSERRAADQTESNPRLDEMESWQKLHNSQETLFRDELDRLLKPDTLSAPGKWEEMTKAKVGFSERAVTPEELLAMNDKVEGEASPEKAACGFFVDRDVEEGVIYAYRVVLSAKPKDLPEDVKTQENSKGKKIFNGYLPLLRLGDSYMLPKAEFEKQLGSIDKGVAAKETGKATAPKNSIEAFVKQSLAQVKPENLTMISGAKNASGGVFTLFWLDKLDPRRRELASVECYSLFSFSNPVATPIRTSFEFTGLSGNEETAVFWVTLIDNEGNQVKQRFIVARPNLSEEAKGNGKPEVRYKATAATPIGGIAKAAAASGAGANKDVDKNVGEERKLDFTTGWGLVDIRKCKLTITKFALKPKKSASGDAIVDPKTGKSVMEKEYSKSPLELDWEYVVVKDLKRKDRYEPRIKYREIKDNEEIKVNFNPEAAGTPSKSGIDTDTK